MFCISGEWTWKWSTSGASGGRPQYQYRTLFEPPKTSNKVTITFYMPQGTTSDVAYSAWPSPPHYGFRSLELPLNSTLSACVGASRVVALRGQSRGMNVKQPPAATTYNIVH